MNAPIFLTPPPNQSDLKRDQLTARIKLLAVECGLAVSAITTADPFPGLADHLEAHIEAGHVDGMDWFTPERARFSADARNLHQTARSIISVGLAYWPGPTEKPDDGIVRGRISRYAWGKDYHRVLKRRVNLLLHAIESHVGHPVEARNIADTARIVDRAVAARSGLGWYGKHSNIIVPGRGSWVMLGELVVDLDLTPDPPLKQDCGRCTICIDKCPTHAIVAPYTIHAPVCISFLTIEERGIIPHNLRPQMHDWVYGCDVCQEVCPYTKAAKAVDDAELQPASIDNAWPSLHWLLRMTPEEFGKTYFGTPVPRAKRRGLARNAAIALGNTGTEADIPVLAKTLAHHDEPLVRGHAAWALGRLHGKHALDAAWRNEPDPYVREEIVLALGEICH
jgi:epoxyqueuosine reductase